MRALQNPTMFPGGCHNSRNDEKTASLRSDPFDLKHCSFSSSRIDSTAPTGCPGSFLCALISYSRIWGAILSEEIKKKHYKILKAFLGFIDFDSAPMQRSGSKTWECSRYVEVIPTACNIIEHHWASVWKSRRISSLPSPSVSTQAPHSDGHADGIRS